MTTRSHPTPRSHTLFLLILALALPLLAACGGAAVGGGTNATSPQVAAAPTAAAAAVPTAAAAAAATAAPAAAAPTTAAAAPATGSVDSSAPAPAGEITAPPPDVAREPGTIAAQPTPGVPQAPPVNSQQQSMPLKAGEIDDNADIAAYTDYLRNYSGPPARQVDISERYILTVTNERQQPVLDARVRLFDAQQQQIFEGRTVSGGKTIVFPRALGVSANDATLRVLIDKGNSTTEGTLTRGQDGSQSFVLRGAEALPATPKLDVLFLLDATGSMGDEIGQIQQTIVSIAERIDQIQPRPELRFGLVSYRDRGDDYVTRVTDFTTDVAAFQKVLLSTRADGGGDEPESLNEGLHAAIQRVSWADDAVRLSFLVADAPPHLDYEQDYSYVDESRAAVEHGIKVYTIAASNTSDDAEYVMRQIAQQTLAHFIFLTYQPGQNAGTPGDTTTHQVDPAAFSVERLDDLVVQVVQRELAQAQGVS